jgi:hypothetical protein
MSWYEVTNEYHTRTFKRDGDLSALPVGWQRELAALWRLQADVNNGAYPQFLENWGRESYVYAGQALRTIGAHPTAEIIDRCQALVDEDFPLWDKSPEELRQLMPNAVIDCGGVLVKDIGSVLPDAIVARIYELSSDFMKCPDDIAELGMRYYQPFIDEDTA